MKPIIFCNITNMKNYKGTCEEDQPRFGGSYVEKTGFANEHLNFLPVTTNETGSDTCFGFVMFNGAELHIENIIGCKSASKADSVNGVTVVWCAKSSPNGSNRIVGWYRNATAYRREQYIDILFENMDEPYTQSFMFEADAQACVLLPVSDRMQSKWYVPRNGHNGYDFGFGRSNIWYAHGVEENEKLKRYLETLIHNIEHYDGMNRLYEED